MSKFQETLDSLTSAANRPDGMDALALAFGHADQRLRNHAVTLAVRFRNPEELAHVLEVAQDVAARNGAIEALERLGPLATASLIATTRHADPKVVMFATQVLAKIADPAAKPVLAQLAQHSDMNIAQAGIEGLGKLKAADEMAILIEKVNGDPWLQFAAVAALAEIGHEDAVEHLVPLLVDDMLSSLVLEALANIASQRGVVPLLEFGDHALGAFSHGKLIAALANTARKGPLDAYAREAGGAAWLVPALCEALDQTADPLALVAAARTALALGLDAVYPRIIRNYGHDEYHHLEEVVARYRDKWHPSWASFAQNPNAAVRCGALRLWDGDSLTRAYVVQCLSENNLVVRHAALEALGRSCSEADVSELLLVLIDGKLNDRQLATKVLSSMPKERLRRIAGLVAHTSDAESLARLFEIAAATGVRLDWDSIVAASMSPSPVVRQHAVRAVRHVDHESRLALIEHIIDDSDLGTARAALETLVELGNLYPDALARRLKAEGPLRLLAATLIGAKRNRAAVPVVQDLALTGNVAERIAAIHALSGMEEISFLRYVIQLIDDAEPEVRRAMGIAFAAHAEAVDLPVLERMVDSKDWWLRESAIGALSRLSDGKSMKLLAGLLRDEEPMVARNARNALRLRTLSVPPPLAYTEPG